MKCPVTMLLSQPTQFDASWNPVVPAVWEIFDPDGAPFDPGSTASQGLQEAINLAHAEDVNLHVIGGGTGAVIGATATITFPPIRHRSIRIESTTIDVTPAAGAPSMLFDSCIMADFFMSGQLVHHSNGPAVLYAPTNPAIPENEVSCTASVFSFQAIACMVNNGFGVRLMGPIDRTRFLFQEINGNNDHLIAQSYHGIEIVGSCVGSDFWFQNIHGFKSSSLRAGTASGAQVYGNRFTGTICPKPGPGATTVGAEVWGDCNQFNLSIMNNEGVPAIGVQLQPGSGKNYFIVPRNDASPTKQGGTLGTNKGWFGT